LLFNAKSAIFQLYHGKSMSSFRKFGSRHHDLVNLYGISVSQMTTDMFQ